MIVQILITLAIILLIGYFYTKLSSKSIGKALPGPISLPIIGCLWKLVLDGVANTLKMEDWYIQLSKKYGDIFSVYLGQRQFIIFNSYDVVKEAFIDSSTKDIYSGRPQDGFIQIHRYNHGVLFADGQHHKVLRRFALKTMRDFGVGKSAIECYILQEARELCDEFLKHKEKPIDPRDAISKYVGNVITHLIFGQRIGKDDPQFDRYMEMMRNLSQVGGIMMFAPYFWNFLTPRIIFKQLPVAGTAYNCKYKIKEILEHKVDTIMQDYDASTGSSPSCFSEAFLQQKYDMEQNNENKDNIFSKNHLVQICEDLFIAGIDTTSSAINWALVHLGYYPDIQKRMYNEIYGNLADNLDPSYANRDQFPYTLAFLDELHRMMTVVPHSVDKRVVEDTIFRGYHISADAVIHVNLHGIHHDPTLWQNPYKFNPERFLTRDGKYKPSPYLNQFGIGKRSCLGEILARMEVFIQVIVIVQKMEIVLDKESCKNINKLLLGTHGFVHGTIEHKINFKER